jgi:gliding motility-associated-like protein
VPVADILLLDNTGCVPAEVTLASGYNGPGDCVWTVNGQVIEDCGPITVIFEETGSYSVTLAVDANNGCGADQVTLNGLVQVVERPEAAFRMLPEQINAFATQAFFPNSSMGATSYLWTVDGDAVSTATDLQYTFPDQFGDSYTVCLLASAGSFCTDTLCTVVTVEDGPGFHVPNAFTPDNDGLNDLFQPQFTGREPAEYLLQIFDRWGQVIFSTTDPRGGWSGRAANGMEIPIGVYVWKITARDGFSGRPMDALGHVTLVR